MQDQSHRHGWIVHDVEVGVVSQFRPDLQQAYGLAQGLGCGFLAFTKYSVASDSRFLPNVVITEDQGVCWTIPSGI